MWLTEIPERNTHEFDFGRTSINLENLSVACRKCKNYLLCLNSGAQSQLNKIAKVVVLSMQAEKPKQHLFSQLQTSSGTSVALLWFPHCDKLSRLPYLLTRNAAVISIKSQQKTAETEDLGEIRDDLSALDTSVVVLVNEQRLDDDEDLVDVRPHEVIQLVQDAVDDLDQQVALLVLQRRRHQQRQNLVEQRVGAELAGLVGDLSECRLKEYSLPENIIRKCSYTQQLSGVRRWIKKIWDESLIFHG